MVEEEVMELEREIKGKTSNEQERREGVRKAACSL